MRALLVPFFNLFQYAFVFAWSVAWMSAAIVLRLVTGNADRALAMARWGYSPGCLWAARAKLDVEPLPAGVDWSKPHVFVMNHQSALDIVCAFRALPTNLRFIAKHTLQYVPFLGWYMWATGMVFVDRTRRQQAVGSLARAVERVRGGASIIAFPEGTRSRDGRIRPFKKGPFVLALEAGVPVVPVAIVGSGAVMPANSPWVHPGKVRLKVGAPIPTAGLGLEARERVLQQAHEAVVRMSLELGGEGSASVQALEKAA